MKKRKVDQDEAKSKVGENKSTKIGLIVTDESSPQIRLEAGVKFEVQTVSLIDSASFEPTEIAARLCGGTSTCLALIKTDINALHPEKVNEEHQESKIGFFGNG